MKNVVPWEMSILTLQLAIIPSGVYGNTARTCEHILWEIFHRFSKPENESEIDIDIDRK